MSTFIDITHMKLLSPSKESPPAAVHFLYRPNNSWKAPWKSSYVSVSMTFDKTYCGLVHCPGGNATDPIWRVLAFSDGISCWTPLKPQHSNHNPNPLANQLWCINFLTSRTPLIIPHRHPVFLESLMPLKNWCSIYAKAVWSIPYVSVPFFTNLKQNFIAYRFSNLPSRQDCIFEIHQLWQSVCIPIAAVAAHLNLKS